MPDEIVIRECGVRDIDRVLALWARVAVPVRVPATAEAVRERLRRDRDLFVVACDGPEIVGSLVAGWDGWRGNMYRMAVGEAYRRQGIAGLMLSTAESRLRTFGAERVTALVMTNSPSAAPFWESAGYRPDYSVRFYTKRPEGQVVAPGDFEIRACATGDIDRVLALWSRAAAAAHVPDTAEGIRLRLRREREFFLLACDGPEIVGSVMAGFDGWRANMYRMAVEPAYRRNGLATYLLAEVESRLAAQGVRGITALVMTDSPPAMPFWENAGYVQGEFEQRYVKDLREVL